MIERPYPLLVEHGPTGAVHLSGAGGLDLDDRPVLDDRGAVDAALDSVRRRLAAVGLGLEHLFKLDYYVTDLALRAAIDDQYRRSFPAGGPARMVVGVAALPLGVRVLIDALAYRPAEGMPTS